MITGRVPFRGDHAQAVTYAILNSDPEPVTGLRTGVPLELERIIGKCLAKPPLERYQHADDLLTDLRVLQRQTCHQPTANMATGGTSPKGARRWPWILGAFVALGLLIAWGIARILPNSGKGPAELPRLAVLPFENLGEAEDEYFSDGITDEIIVKLTAVDGLRVLARTSSRSCQGMVKSAAEVGRLLNVDYVLEGTIRWQKSPDGSSVINIAPKLVATSDGTQLWADTYRAEYGDIFELQSNIAIQVSEAMGVELLPRARSAITTISTHSLEAYDLYLKGLKYEMAFSKPYMAEMAIRMFDAAVAIDPDFVEAWGKICKLNAFLYNIGWTENDPLRRSQEAGDKALSIDADILEVQIGLGYYYYFGHRDYDTAMNHFKQARMISPGSPDAFVGEAAVLRRWGEYERSLAQYRKALELDPRNPTIMIQHAYSMFYLRDFEGQIETGKSLIMIAPDNTESYWVLLDGLINAEADSVRLAQAFETALEHGSVLQVVEVAEDIGAARSLLARLENVRVQFLAANVLPGSSALEQAELEYMKGYAMKLNGDVSGPSEYFLRVVGLLEAMIAANPEIYHFYPVIADSYSQIGRHGQAIDLCRQGLLQDMIATDQMSRDKLQSDLAAVLASDGQKEEAINLVRDLMQRPSHLNIGRLKADPAWAPLRDDPRFSALLVSQ